MEWTYKFFRKSIQTKYCFRKNIKLAILISIIFSFYSYSQTILQNFKWEYPNEVNISDTTAGKVILLKNSIFEYTYENNLFIEYNLFHNVEKIFSDLEIEKNNKKFINTNTNSNIIDAGIRILKSNGDTILMDKSKILKAIDEKTGEQYFYFAVEGLSKGDIIDYYYIIKKSPSFTGNYELFQDQYPILTYKFELYSPENLIFKFKLLNDTSQIFKDTTFTNKNHWILVKNNIPPIINAVNFPAFLYTKKILFKLDENKTTGTKDIISYDKAASTIYRSIYNNITRKEQKVIKKIVKKIGILDSMTQEQKIFEIENYLKNNYNIIDISDNEYENLYKIYKNNIANNHGITKLFANLFNYYNINHNLVITSNRTKFKFDPEFESYLFLNQYLFYFPETKKYLIPDKFAFRYGLIPFEFTDNYGLFISRIKLYNVTTYFNQIKYIEPLSFEESAHNLNITATINNECNKIDIELIQENKGYYSVYLQPYLGLLKKEDQEKIAHQIIKNLFGDININEWNFKNIEPETIGLKPLILEAKFSSTLLLENAGNNIIFKVGQLIGPQIELYKETERTAPVYDDYKRSFNRILKIKIPSGYEIKNLEELNIDKSYEKNNKKILSFKSTYSLNNNLLTVNIEEFYDSLYLEPIEFDKYREIINTAADFNKIILILEKI